MSLLRNLVSMCFWKLFPRHPEYQLLSVSFPKMCLKKLYHTSQEGEKNVQKNGLFNKLNLVPRTISTFECNKLKQKPWLASDQIQLILQLLQDWAPAGCHQPLELWPVLQYPSLSSQIKFWGRFLSLQRVCKTVSLFFLFCRNLLYFPSVNEKCCKWGGGGTSMFLLRNNKRVTKLLKPLLRD